MKVTNRALVSPWTEAFDELLSQASKNLLVCSPYIGKGPCKRILTLLRERNRTGISVQLLTDLSRENMLSEATDVKSILELCGALPNMDIRFLPRIHAKVYVADERTAIVTSGNLTDSGLSHNFEYGIYLTDKRLVRRIRCDLTQYHSLGTVIQQSQLKVFDEIVTELKGMQQKAEKSLKSRLREEFEAKLLMADEEILRVRAEGLSAHAAFADTIVYILRRGPRNTKGIYAEMKAIHPDLCDDTMKLVIRGQAWPQAQWRHRVRHAQLYLARQGRIVRKDDKWQLV